MWAVMDKIQVRIVLVGPVIPWVPQIPGENWHFLMTYLAGGSDSNITGAVADRIHVSLILGGWWLHAATRVASHTPTIYIQLPWWSSPWAQENSLADWGAHSTGRLPAKPWELMGPTQAVIDITTDAFPCLTPKKTTATRGCKSSSQCASK